MIFITSLNPVPRCTLNISRINPSDTLSDRWTDPIGYITFFNYHFNPSTVQGDTINIEAIRNGAVRARTRVTQGADPTIIQPLVLDNILTGYAASLFYVDTTGLLAGRGLSSIPVIYSSSADNHAQKGTTHVITPGYSTYDVVADLGSFSSRPQHGDTIELKLEKIINDTAFRTTIKSLRDTFFLNSQWAADTAIQFPSEIIPPSYIDFAVDSILAPFGQVDTGTIITPKAVIQNLGNVPKAGSTRMRIGGQYNQTIGFNTIIPGGLDTLLFPDWTALQRGNNPVKCSTMVDGDQNPTNDYKIGNVFVRVRDVGTENILIPAPGCTLRQRDTIVPKVLVKNYGNVSETFGAYFRIRKGTMTVYNALDSIFGLAPGGIRTAEFDTWIAGDTNPVGQFSEEVTPFTVCCFTVLHNDVNLANDSSEAGFYVDYWIGIRECECITPEHEKRAPTIAKAPFHAFGIEGDIYNAIGRQMKEKDLRRGLGVGIYLVRNKRENRRIQTTKLVVLH